jgi:immunity protein 10 of polymorphic toxin system
MQRFIANAVAAVELSDINTVAVVLAQEPDGSGVRLEIQRSLSFNEQDRRCGQDTYCLCTEHGATWYGGVRSWTLGPNSLEIMLEPRAAEALGVQGGFVVDFAPEHLPILKERLQKILG